MPVQPGAWFADTGNGWFCKSSAIPELFRFIESTAQWFLKRAVSTPQPSSSSPAPISVHARPVQPETPTPQTQGAFTYQDWILEQEPDDAGLAAQRDLAAAFAYQPKISILVPVYKVPSQSSSR
jgi:hypothetical protein